MGYSQTGGSITELLLRFVYISGFLIILSGMFAAGYNFLKNDTKVVNFTGLSNKSTMVDCFYYSLAVTTGIGHGDIAPISPNARMMVTAQRLMATSLIITLFIPTSTNCKSGKVAKSSEIKTMNNSSNVPSNVSHERPVSSVGHTVIQQTDDGTVLKTLLPTELI